MARGSDGDGFLDKAVIIIAVDEAKPQSNSKTRQILDKYIKKRNLRLDQNGDPIGADL